MKNEGSALFLACSPISTLKGILQKRSQNKEERKDEIINQTLCTDWHIAPT
jgi:hypothetical protein